MTDYYFDEERAIAYKIYPVTASSVRDEEKSDAGGILVHTNVKMTNYKKEKVRRTLSELYPSEQYTLETAKEKFCNTVLARILNGARKISEEEYELIKARVEV